MKRQTILPLLFVATLIACNSDKTRDFVSGTYINHSEGDYSIADDTLVIESSERNNFLIHRKTGIRLIKKGKPGKFKYETEEWRAIYDEGTKTLTETKRGKLFSFYPEAGKLTVGKREYQKIE